jgi:ABC-type polysaccharide/polyol phosphate export permease
MKGYLADLWAHRHFLLSLVQMDLQTRYRRSVLGVGWSLVHPIATSVVMCIVFHSLFHMSVTEFLPYLMAGLAWWGYFTTVISRGCQCFVEAESFIRQQPVPMALYPLRTALGAMIHFLMALAVVLFLTWCFHGFGNIAALPGLAAGLAILLVFGWAIAVLAGYVNTIFRDIQHLTDIGFQILFYLTPIMYKPEVLTNNDLGGLVTYSPLVALLRTVRDPLVASQVPSLRVYGAALATTLLAVGAATLLLDRVQRKVILYL